MMQFLGFGDDATKTNSTSAQKALPSVWYRSPAMYELERRAIFSRKWLLVTHKSRFVNPGNFIRFTQAGFNFFLCLDRQGNLNGFHNICRHRAYPLVEKDSGTVSILACKYHGWSYGLNGKLAKAPRFDTVSDSPKDSIALIPVHTYIDSLGFVWVNLESGEKPEVSWQTDFEGVDAQPRYKHFNWNEYKYDHSWEMTGMYNWKTLADNYNECYHCPTGHPGVLSVSDLSAYYVNTTSAHIQHFNKNKDDNDNVHTIASTFYFPNASMTVSPHFMYMMRCIPVSASETKMEYEVYRHINASDAEFNEIDSFFKQVLKEDTDLCEATQRNLNSGSFVSGTLHPFCEKGPIYFQSLVKDLVTEHHKKEESSGGRKIWPTRQRGGEDGNTLEDIKFCEGLSCGEAQGNKLAW